MRDFVKYLTKTRLEEWFWHQVEREVRGFELRIEVGDEKIYRKRPTTFEEIALNYLASYGGHQIVYPNKGGIMLKVKPDA